MQANQAYKGRKFGGAPPPIEIGAVQGEHGDQVDVWTFQDGKETSPIRLTIDQPEQRFAEAWLSVELANDLIAFLQVAIIRVSPPLTMPSPDRS